MTQETTLHLAIVEYLTHALPTGALLHHSPNEGRHHVAHRVRLKKMGMCRGWPDLEIIYQHSLYFLEIKTPQGRLSPAQKSLHTQLRDQGCQVEVIRSLDEVHAWVAATFGVGHHASLLVWEEAHA